MTLIYALDPIPYSLGYTRDVQIRTSTSKLSKVLVWQRQNRPKLTTSPLCRWSTRKRTCLSRSVGF